jgi:HSP20 family protein
MAERQTAMTPRRQERGLANRGDWSSSPFRAFQRMADQMDQMFEDFGLGRRWTSPLLRETGRETGQDAWAPDIDVFQKDNELTIRVDLPGLKREDVTVDIAEDAVTIQGERKHEHEEEREGYYRSERTYGSFYRVIPLPQGVIPEQAKAHFKDGVLEVTIPAPPASKGRRLEIEEGAARK